MTGIPAELFARAVNKVDTVDLSALGIKTFQFEAILIISMACSCNVVLPVVLWVAALICTFESLESPLHLMRRGSPGTPGAHQSHWERLVSPSMSEDVAGKGAELTLKLTTTVVCKALCSSFTNFFGLEENVHKQH